MIELPESATLARQLRATVAGCTIQEAEAGHSPHGFAFYHGDPAAYGALLRGRAVEDAFAVAGMVELRLEGGVRLLLNDGANLRYLPPGGKTPAKHQLLLQLSDGGQLAVTVQMYAGITAFREGAYDSPYYAAAREKPSPLGGAFTDGYWQALLAEAKPTLSAKALLATEQRIPGLGNGVLQDILLRAGIHPKSKLIRLSGGDRARLFQSVRETLAAMAAGGGRDTERDLFGQPGGYATLLSAKSYARPCPYCGGPITRQAYLGGNVYFCAHCQPLQA